MITLDTIELPYELLWSDEFAWTGVVAGARYSLQGTQHIQKSKTQDGKGRAITLMGPDAWISRATLLLMYAKAADIETESMVLTLHDGRTFNVIFRHWEPPAIEATPIKKLANPGSDEEYILTLRLVTV
jgi:hypothetical protein